MLRMFGEQIRLQVSPKLFGSTAGSRRWSGSEFQTASDDRKCTGPKGTATNSWNWQLMTSAILHGRSQVLANSNFTDWRTVVGEIPWSSVPKTTTDCHSKLVLHCTRWGITSQCRSLQVIVHQPRQTTLIFPGPIDQTCCSILNVLQLVRGLLRRERQNRVTVVDTRCDKLTKALTLNGCHFGDEMYFGMAKVSVHVYRNSVWYHTMKKPPPLGLQMDTHKSLRTQRYDPPDSLALTGPRESK